MCDARGTRGEHMNLRSCTYAHTEVECNVFIPLTWTVSQRNLAVQLQHHPSYTRSTHTTHTRTPIPPPPLLHTLCVRFIST